MSILLYQPGNEVMAVAIFSFLEDGAVEHAAAVGALVALLSVATVVIARKVAGKGADGGCMAVIFVSVILPMSGLVILSLLKTFGASISLSNFTVTNYEIFFDESFLVWPSVQNSFMLAISTASLCILFSIVYVWLVERTTIPGRGVITALIMLTFGFPAVAMGVAILLGYIDLLYGTLSIILVAYIAKRIPFAFIFLRNSIKQIMEELEEAARISGASWLRSVKDITVPLMKTGMVAACILFSIVYVWLVERTTIPGREYGGGHQGECHPEGGAQAARPEGAGRVLIGGIDVVQRGAYRKQNQGIVMQGQDEDKAGHREYIERHLLQAEKIHEEHVQLPRIRGQQKDPGDRSDKRGDDEGNPR